MRGTMSRRLAVPPRSGGGTFHLATKGCGGGWLVGMFLGMEAEHPRPAIPGLDAEIAQLSLIGDEGPTWRAVRRRVLL